MPDLTTHRPTALDRVVTLAGLVAAALEDFEVTDHGILWDALVDARAALNSSIAVVSAVHMDPTAIARPALVCATCGHHLRPSDAVDRRDYLFERDHHEKAACRELRSNGDVPL